MQETSALHKEIFAAPGHYAEHKVLVAGVEYGSEDLVSISSSGGLFDTFGVGNCAARQLDISLLPKGEIPRQAKLQVFTRLVLGIQTSEWLPKGEFFISTRDLNKRSGVLSITAYDAMLKGEDIWLTADYDTQSWPMDQSKAVADIAARMGVEVDSRTVLSTKFPVAYPVDENGDLTMREVLGYIAVSNAGNWTVTDQGRLRLVPLADLTQEPYPLGAQAADLETGEPQAPVSRVNLTVDSEHYYTAGDDTGRTLELTCPWGSQAMAEHILAAVKDCRYTPFSASDALLDPAVELGDAVSVGDISSVIISAEISFDLVCAPSISAPDADEIDEEYPYKSRQQREIERSLAKTRALIAKSSEEILLKVEDELDGLSSGIDVKLGSITSQVTGLSGRVTTVEQTAQSLTASIQAVNGEVTALSLTLDGLTVTTAGGVTKIKGSVIETGSLVLTGSISWGDLDSGVQSDINSALDRADEAYELADSIQLPSYIRQTYISSTEIRSPEITGGTLTGGRVVGGSFHDLEENCEFYMESSGGTGSLYNTARFSSAAGGTIIAFTGRITSYTGTSYCTISSSYELRPSGTWDFSDADVSGLYLTFA